MSEEKRYTLGEAVAALGLIGVGLPLIAIIGIPFGLFTAWIRMTIWNWFHAAFGFPSIGLWPMFVVGLLLMTWRSGSRALKPEFYRESYWQWLSKEILSNLLTLFIAWGVHLFWHP